MFDLKHAMVVFAFGIHLPVVVGAAAHVFFHSDHREFPYNVIETIVLETFKEQKNELLSGKHT